MWYVTCIVAVYTPFQLHFLTVHLTGNAVPEFDCGPVNSIALNLLCDGDDDCPNGEDEKNTVCESKLIVHIQLQVNSCKIKTDFLPPDKCYLPYYGGCSYTRLCITSDHSVSCGDCLPGLAEADPITNDCIGK